MAILEVPGRVHGPSGMPWIKVINYKMAAWALEVQTWQLAANLARSSSPESAQPGPFMKWLFLRSAKRRLPERPLSAVTSFLVDLTLVANGLACPLRAPPSLYVPQTVPLLCDLSPSTLLLSLRDCLAASY